MRRGGVLLVALLLVALLAGCDDDSVETSRAATPIGATTASTDPAGASQLLYAIRGVGSSDGTTLRTQVDGDVTWITDRPDRRAGRTSPGALVAGWDAAGFTDDPPNAVLVTSGGAVAVELSDPGWDDATRTLSFTATALAGGTVPTGPLGVVELFVDDQQACQVSDYLLTVDDLPPSAEFSCSDPAAATAVQTILDAQNQAQAGVPSGDQIEVDIPLVPFAAFVFGTDFTCNPDDSGNIFCEADEGSASLSLT